MARFRFILEYDGAGFVGWQRQINGFSVQEAVETAIGKFTNETPTVIAAGRTDSGVHALGMAAHADIARDMPAEKIRDALNFHLRPHAVVALKVELVVEDFSARFDCTARHYRYRILNRPVASMLLKGKVWHVSQPLDIDAMQAAANHLIGKHDFQSFRSAHCQAESAVKTLDVLTVTRTEDEVQIHASARSFLHNQVRILAGTLVEVGKGKWQPEDVRTALQARDRAAAGPTAPAWGLYFLRADYPA